MTCCSHWFPDNKAEESGVLLARLEACEFKGGLLFFVFWFFSIFVQRNRKCFVEGSDLGEGFAVIQVDCGKGGGAVVLTKDGAVSKP